MTDKQLEQVGRILLRREGDWWVARFGQIGTQAGAVELARMRMHLAQADPKVKEAFIQLSRLMMSRAIIDTLGTAPIWKDPERAPEHERSGTS
jgi:hypothetical protein